MTPDKRLKAITPVYIQRRNDPSIKKILRSSTHTRLLLIALVLGLSSVVCTSGYITPDSLTATAAFFSQETSVPTAFFLNPNITSTVEENQSEIDDATATISVTLTQDITDITATATEEVLGEATESLVYFAQAGDTLFNLSVRFSVNPLEIASTEIIPETGLIKPKQLLNIPKRLGETSSDQMLLPDSEVVYSNSAKDFDTITFVNVMDGKLESYRYYLGSTGVSTGAQILERVAIENSINPRLLLSLLQYQSNWVFGQPTSLSQSEYPMGFFNHDEKDLYNQLTWASNQLATGYYGWREGKLTNLNFADQSTIRLAPTLNSGTVAILYFFNQAYPNRERWQMAVDPDHGFVQQHIEMFGDPQARAAAVEPLLPANLEQPPLILPFMREQMWAYTGGPHGAWELEGAQAAIDFAPGSMLPGCVKSDKWVLAAAPGVIVRLANGVVVLDLDGDGNELTGWNLLYLHLNNIGHLKIGQWVEKGDLLGNPSCEGGISTGTHIHLARKYNGEWISASGPVPFNLGGWVAQAGDEPYQGTLVRGDKTITASTVSTSYSNITRTDDDP